MLQAVSIGKNILNMMMTTSRGGGIKSRIKAHKVISRVHPGAKLNFLTARAEKMIDTTMRLYGHKYDTQDIHVYILGGLCDITHKISEGWYTECIYTENTEDTIRRVTGEFDKCAEKIKKKGAKPIFCTITSCDIAKYNTHLLTTRKTYTLHHQHNYAEMQKNLEIAIKAINAHIVTINQNNHASTPYTHSEVHKRRGSKPSYFKWVYDRLHDGVHGTHETKNGWAHIIGRAMTANKTRITTDTDYDECKSPPRSWQSEKRIKLSI